MKPNWGLKKNMNSWLLMQHTRYQNSKGTIMDVKWEPDSDNGWAVCGNNWANVYLGLEFPVTYGEIVKDGWKRI